MREWGKTTLAAKILDDIEDNLVLDNKFSYIICLSAKNSDLSLGDIFYYIKSISDEKMAFKIDNIWKNNSFPDGKRAKELITLISAYNILFLIDNFEDMITDSGKLIDEGLQLFFHYLLSIKNTCSVMLTSRKRIYVNQLNNFITHVPLSKGLSLESGIKFLRFWDRDNTANLKEAPDDVLITLVKRTFGIRFFY